MANETPMQEFIHLLEEAHSARQEVDDFDVRSDDEESLSRFKALCAAQSEAFQKLVGFVALESRDILDGIEHFNDAINEWTQPLATPSEE